MAHGLELDRALFPTLDAYLDALPEGLDSYPEAQSKGTLLRSSIDGHDVEKLVVGLPPPLRALIESPPPGGVWVPAVHSDAVFHAVCDRFYPTDAEMLAWTEQRTVAVAHSPMYSAVFRVTGPAMLLRVTAKVHGLAQRGTKMDAAVHGTSAKIHMSFAPHLHSRLNLLSNVGMLMGVARMTGARQPRASMTLFTATSALYDLAWT